MKYLVDTSVWSLVLRRPDPGQAKVVALLGNLIDRGKAVLCGAVRQELLSGIKRPDQFKLLKIKLREFDEVPADIVDYELAAEFSNICRSNGVQASSTDFLLCALCVNHNLALLTTDNDFAHIKKFVDFNLEIVRLSFIN